MLETEAVTVTVEFSTPCVTQIVTVCDPGKVENFIVQTECSNSTVSKHELVSLVLK